MQTILIVVHLMIVLALVGVVLLQRSEGGGLGIGGGSGFMTARGAANALTRATAILAAAFFATSLSLSILARYQERPIDILDRLPAGQGSGQGVLDQLGGSNAPAAPATPAAPAVPAAPATEGSATPAPAAPAVAQPAAPAAETPSETPASTAPAAPQVPNN